MERLQLEKVPCVISNYIMTRRLRAAQRAPPREPRTIQLLCNLLQLSYLFTCFSIRNFFTI